MSHLFTMQLPVPVSANKNWGHGRGRVFLSHETRKFRLSAKGEYARLQALRLAPATTIAGGVHLSCSVPARFDVDNTSKALLDALENAKVIKNDSQVLSLLTKKDPDNAEPFVVVNFFDEFKSMIEFYLDDGRKLDLRSLASASRFAM